MTPEYGIWQTDSKSGSYHTMGICRHHNLEEFRVWFREELSGNYSLQRQCLHCIRDKDNHIYHGNIPGCGNYTGIHIAEKMLSKVFSYMEKAPVGYPYDFICNKGLRVDSKCSLMKSNLNRKSLYWSFCIRKNKKADVFCLIALDNISNNVAINPMVKYVWLVPGDALIGKRVLNDRTGLGVTVGNIEKLDKYRRVDMEGRIIKCCNSLKK